MSSTPSTKPTNSQPPRAGIPVLGALPYLVGGPLDYVMSARARYGDIYTLDLGIMSCIALNHPNHAQHVLRDNARNYQKGGPVWDYVRTFVGNGLPTSDGDFWRRQRRMLQPQFHRERLTAMFGLIDAAITETLEDWEKSADSGEVFAASQAISRMTMNVIVKTMFGADVVPEESERVTQALAYAFGYLVPNLLAQSVPKWVPVPGRQRFTQALKTVDEMVFRLIERRRKRGSSGMGGSLIGMMLDAVDAETGETMTDQQLRDEAVATFIAGYETTATVLAFAFANLAEHPEIAQALSDESHEVLGQSTPTLSHISKMPKTAMVLNEALRMYPAAYWLPRTAIADDVIDGYHIPAGKMVAIMVYVLQRHPAFWEEPDRFDPWRFTPERSANRHPLAWLPFGTGQRQCIGKDLALMEGQLILARLLSRYEFTLAPGRTVEPELAATLRPRGGVWLQVRTRKPRPRVLAAVG